jgi:hypothetical protein
LPLLAGDSIPTDLQVSIYQNNVNETFRKALASSYPVVERLVGEDCFRGLCREYLRRYPSRSGSLQQYGACFVEFLTDVYAGTGYGYLPDVAGLEWASEEVLAGPECNVTDLQTLVSVDPSAFASLRFRFHESVRLIRSDYPVLAIWRANQPGESTAVDLSTGAEHVAVMRRGGDAMLRLVPAGVFQLIQALQEGKTFVEACDSILGSSGKNALVAVLASLVTLGA